MKPILFNTDMVRALLDNRKTVTRRVVKPQPVHENGFWKIGGAGWSDNIQRITPVPCHSLYYRAPYRPGDILYVRETWNYGYCDKTDFEFQYNETFFEELSPGSCQGSFFFPRYFYRTEDLDGIVGMKWHPSIHMPREAARLFLRVTDVRVERLQDIDDDGVVAEGLEIGAPFDELWNRTIKKAYRALYGWDANPWVWVIEFERIGREEDVNERA